MRLIFKVLLSLLSVLLLFGVLWLSLPRLLTELMERQLAQSGFTNIEANISELNLHLTAIDRLKMSNASLDILIEGLQLKYDLSRLLSGQLISIEAEKIVLNRLPTQGNAAVLPDPALLARLLIIPWQRYNPADFMILDELSLYDANGDLSLTSSIDVSRQGESTRAAISLQDRVGKNHLLELLGSPDSGIEMQWQSPDSDSKNPVSVRIYPQDHGSGLAGQVSIDLSAMNSLLAEPGSLSGQMQAEFSYLERVDGPGKSISVSAKLHNVGIAGNLAKSISLDLEGILVEENDGFSLKIVPSSMLEINNLQLEDNKIEKAVITLPRSLNFVNGRPIINSGNGAEIKLGNVVMDNIKLPQVQIKEIVYSTGHGADAADVCSFMMKLIVPDMTIGDVKFQAAPYKVKGVCPGAENQQWSVTAETHSVAIENNDFQLPLNDCRLNAESADNGDLTKISGSAICQSNNQKAQINTRFQFDTDAGSGYADYTVDEIKPGKDKPLFSSLLKDWQQPYDIDSGTLSVKGRYSWWKNKQGEDREKLSMRLNIDNAGGYYDEISFSGLNYKDQIELLPAIKSSEFSGLSIENIDIGVPVTSVMADLLLSASGTGPLPLVKVNRLSLSLLDGQVKGNDLNIDLNADVHEMVLVVDGLDLAQIVALQELDGLSATGRLDGYIPVTLTNNGIKIEKGRIVAQQPGGYIRYRPAGGTAEMEKSVVGSEFVFRIIENLDYDSLKVDVDYAEDGEMEMKLSIKGMSPKVDTKRPVHFNLNIQQNVLKLLQGLRYAEGLSEEIDKKVQKNFSK